MVSFSPFLSTPSARRATLPIALVRHSRSIFLSTPSARRATCTSHIKISYTENFYPRPPRGGRLFRNNSTKHTRVISIHALREEGDCGQTVPRLRGGQISIHALREEGDAGILSNCLRKTLFLSTPSARRATLLQRTGRRAYQLISIHALREEGDIQRGIQSGNPFQFLSTPSARRATATLAASRPLPKTFLSTPSARRATAARSGCRWVLRDFYPRPPRGGRQQLKQAQPAEPEFLSTPSARRATGTTDYIQQPDEFLSTPSARRATW